MRALILGVGDAFTRLHYGSSALIEAPEGHILLDCPDPIHRVIHEAASRHGWEVDVSVIDDIVLTHLHGDHCNGLESVGFTGWVDRKTGARQNPPRLHTTAPVIDRLWQRLAPAMDTLIGVERPVRIDDYFDVRLLEPETEATIAGLRVRCRFTTHHVPTIGLLISDGQRTLGWSGDTLFEAAHIEWLNAADLIVHETNHPPAHTTIEELNALPDALRRKIRLIHMGDDFDPASTDMRPLTDGELLEL